MYVPAAFSVTDPEQLHEFIRGHSFAVLVSPGESSNSPPTASHLPLLLRINDDGTARLDGHMAKGNAQWRLADAQQVLAIFSGPHAHISAGWYGEQNVVPTWNYVAVHVTGKLRIERDPDRLLTLLQETVSIYEAGSRTTWSLESIDPDFRQRMIESIVGFSIEIGSIQGCWKLNQHHSESRRAGAIAGLRTRAAGDDLEIADLMEAAVRR
jgi:transcriptional regulator